MKQPSFIYRSAPFYSTPPSNMDEIGGQIIMRVLLSLTRKTDLNIDEATIIHI